MPEYPVHVPRDRYRGSDPNRRERTRDRNDLAARLEEHINRRFEEAGEDHMQFIFGYMAIDLGIPVEDIRSVLSSLGGHNGFSVWR